MFWSGHQRQRLGGGGLLVGDGHARRRRLGIVAHLRLRLAGARQPREALEQSHTVFRVAAMSAGTERTKCQRQRMSNNGLWHSKPAHGT